MNNKTRAASVSKTNGAHPNLAAIAAAAVGGPGLIIQSKETR
ncbi:MAG TPA: hypothetical protein VK570_01715 [Rubrivivax sp.]|nr:hypothetical protein [Rubrivivax sp.]